MRFALLGSGSRGNATLIEAGDTCLMIDCGFSLTAAERRLARLGRSPRDIDAILVTHEHTDHAGGVARFAARYGIPLWLTAGTQAALASASFDVTVSAVAADELFAIGDVEVLPVAVPHDAREPVQFVFGDGRHRIGVLTDAGCVTPSMLQAFSRCEALVLECNHDATLLQLGDYPPALKERVGGPHGHLSNEQAADFLRRIDTGRLVHVVAAHLSEKNNTPALARAALAAALGCAPQAVEVATQEEGLAWRQT
ncbi:MAG TPA: MBL fold metallo-hydrolase [Gammaproteobacteria bacterium]|nr:MBL fold metallo-hydrolase [Gammaproteobacteria bacterium]